MTILGKLFGSHKAHPEPYVDAGIQLIHNIVERLSLPGWGVGPFLDPKHTSEEIHAIEKSLSSAEGVPPEGLMAQAASSPEAADVLRHTFVASALRELAGRWRFSTDGGLPEDWRDCVSTYLKAWACDLMPMELLDMAELLAKAGYKGEAKQALEVVLLFPSYTPRTQIAHSLSSGEASRLARKIVDDAQNALREL